MEEIWKDVKGYEGLYQVSNMGRIKSFAYKTWRIKKPIVQNSGYAHIGFYKKGVCKQARLHRIVAEAFCYNPDPKNKTQINHLNEDKLDNRACNLQWASPKENTNYGSCLIKRGKAISKRKLEKRSVFCFSLAGQYVAMFRSCAEASEWACKDRNNRNIATACRGRQKTAFGFCWAYAQPAQIGGDAK